jgi:hypothetical protein
VRQSKGLRLAAVTAAVLVLAGCGGVDITYNGGAVTNGEDFLVALERSFRADLADEETPANVHEDARCYFGSTGEGKITEVAFCGPVLHQFGSKKKPFDAYELSLSGSGDERSVALDGGPETGVAPPTGISLVRPDGEDVPEGLGGLAVPPPPALEPGTAMSLSQETGDRLTEVEDGRLNGFDFRFREKGFAEVETVGKGREQRRAADGEKLVLVRYDYLGHEPASGESGEQGSTGGTRSTSDATAAAPTATVVVDGARTTINDALGAGEGGLFAVSVPADADSVGLEMGQAGVEQTLDLLTGERAASAPAILYRDSPDLQTDSGFTRISTAVNKTFDLPFKRGDVFDGKYPTRLTVERMDLQYWIDPSTPAPSPDVALLKFVVKTSGGNTWGGPVDPARVTLVADDGKTYAATSDNGSAGFNLMNNRYWFEVPATFTGGTVTIAPGVVIHAIGFSQGATLDYNDATAQFAIKVR